MSETNVTDLPLSLSKSYIGSWGISESVRELIQNALDCDDHTIEVIDGVLKIQSYSGCLSHKHLLLGCGDKTSNGSKRGGHCEGLVLALLVMAREDVDITFISGSDKWTPYLKFNEDFQEDCLHLRIEPYREFEDSVIIEVHNLNEETGDNFLESKELDYIIDNTLILQDQGYSKHETTYGDILLEPQHKGKIFCGGLFVQTINGFDEGFNFKPEYLSLDRDRRMVSTFDIQWITKEMWGEVAEDPSDTLVDYIVQGVTDKSESLRYLHHADNRVSEKVKEKVLEVYKDKYCGKLLANSYEEKEVLIASGNDNADYIGNDCFLHILDQTEEYQTIKMNTKVERPLDWLEEFKDKHYDDMTSDMLYDYEDLCTKLHKVLK